MRKIAASISMIAACGCLLLPGCFAAPTSALVSVPRDTAQTCRSHCSQIGLKMSAVVIIMNSAGCVCAPQGAVGQSHPGASAVAGAAMIRAKQQAAQRRNK